MNPLKLLYKSLILSDDFLSELRLNDYLYHSVVVLIISLVVIAAIPFALNLKLACASLWPSPQFERFVSAKNTFSKYSVLIIFLSWLVGLLSSIKAARGRVNLRRFVTLLNLSSPPLMVMGFMSLLSLAVSPGVLIPCDFTLVDLKRFIELAYLYITTAPGVASPLLLFVGLIWSSWRLYIMLRRVLLVGKETALRIILYFAFSSLVTPILMFLITYLLL